MEGLGTEAYEAAQGIFPIAIRENLVVRLHGLPHDLTKAEAEKIARVVQALANTSTLEREGGGR